MKIQIISKIAKNHSGIKDVKETSIAKRNRLSLQTDQNVEDQYYPRKQIKKGSQHEGLCKGRQGRLFFQQFQKKCAVIYQKVNSDLPKVQRQLEPILAAMINHHRGSTQISEYEFSFKKKESTTSTIPTQQTQSPRQSQQYFFNRGHKNRLRKFNSLMALRAQQTHRVEQQPIFQGQKIILRKNCSLVKCDQGSYLRQGTKQQSGPLGDNVRRSLHSQYCFEAEVVHQNTQKQSARVFAEQKDRLARIRRQLNEVYQMRKPQRLQLF